MEIASCNIHSNETININNLIWTFISYIICGRKDVGVIFGKNENDILNRGIINDEIYRNNCDYTLPSSSGNIHLF